MTFSLRLNILPFVGRIPDGGIRRERYARIVLKVTDASGTEVRRIVDITWDCVGLLRWALENEPAIRSAQLPAFVPAGRSIAERVQSFYAAIDENDDDTESERIFEYNQGHNLRFALHGVDVQAIYVGVNEGEHELSCAESEPWRYVVGLDSFFRDAKELAYELGITQ